MDELLQWLRDRDGYFEIIYERDLRRFVVRITSGPPGQRQTLFFAMSDRVTSWETIYGHVNVLIDKIERGVRPVVVFETPDRQPLSESERLFPVELSDG